MKFEMREKVLKNGETLTIREGKPEDAQAIIDYLDIVGPESKNLYVEDGSAFTLEGEREYLKSTAESPDNLYIIGEVNGEIVATALTGRETERPRGAHRGSLVISVQKKCWGLGVGRAMIDVLLDFAKSINIELMELEVKVDNERGIGLYESVGFRNTAIHEAMFKIDGEYVDAYIMKKWL